MFESVDRRTEGQTDLCPILNIGPVNKGPLIRGQASKITGRRQFSSELARYYKCGSRGGDRGSGPPLENHKLYGFL